MKWRRDQNLSSALVVRISDLFPESQHLKDLGMAQAEDGCAWNHVAANGFTIVSKDSGFRLRGRPPFLPFYGRQRPPLSLRRFPALATLFPGSLFPTIT
jgi:hypothetical protein